MAEASLNGHRLGACPRAVRANQSSGSADQGLQEEVEELAVQGWRGDCRSLPEIVGCAVSLLASFGFSMISIYLAFRDSCLGFSRDIYIHLDASRSLSWI